MRSDVSSAGLESDRRLLEDLVGEFFAAFRSGAECSSRFEQLRRRFLPGAVIVRTCGDEPVLYDVDSFLEPRLELLTDGSLVDFAEAAERGRLEVFGDLAQWFGSYSKGGLHDGAPYAGRGMKSLQFVRTRAGWRISAAAWDDERPGLCVEQHHRDFPSPPGD